MASNNQTADRETELYLKSVNLGEDEKGENRSEEMNLIWQSKDKEDEGEAIAEAEVAGEDSYALRDAPTSHQKTGSDVGGDDCDNGDGNPPKMTHQVLAAVVIGLTHLGIGTIYGFSGVTLPQLTMPDSKDIYLTPEKVALFGSVINIGAICGAIPIGPIATRIGPKITLLVLLPFTLILWLLLAFSPNVELIIIARIGLGVMTASINPVSIAYVLEMAHKDRRGLLYGAIPIIRQIGYCYVYSLGVSPLSWREIALVCGLTTTVLPFIAIFFFPESPRWLVTKGRLEEARKSLVFFRGDKYNYRSELSGIIAQVETANKKNINNQLRQLCKHSIIKIFTMLSFLTFLVSISGSFALVTYMVPIFQSSSTSVNPYYCAILVASSRTIGTIACSAAIDRLGRRSLHIYTYVVMSITLAIFGIYIYYQETAWALANLKWLPAVIMILYAFFLGFGQPTLFMINGELLPNNIRSIGLSILTSILFTGAFLQTVLFPVMETSIGVHGGFWVFSSCSLSVSIFTYMFVPETSGITLEEITKRQAHQKN